MTHHNNAIKKIARSQDTAKRHAVFASAVQDDIDGLEAQNLATLAEDAAFVKTLDTNTLHRLVAALASAVSWELLGAEEAAYGADR